MAESRETASLAFWFGNCFKRPRGVKRMQWCRWQWSTLKRLLRSPYFWQDNVLTPMNRLIGCRLAGHKVTLITDYDSVGLRKRPFCFRCYTYLAEGRSDE